MPVNTFVRQIGTRLGRVALASVLGATGLAANVAHAVPAALSYEYFGLNFANNVQTSSTFGTLNYTGFPGCGGTCTATTTLGADPSETISVDQVTFEATGGGYSMAELGYYFEVPGAGQTTVTLHAGDSLQATANGFAQAYLAVGAAGTNYTSLNNFLSYSYQDTACAMYCALGVANYQSPAPLPASQSIAITRGQFYYVNELVLVGAATSGVQLTNTADPTFTVSPGDTIEFSPGVVGAVSPVPEPSTMAMMLVGLIGLGTALRFRGRAGPFEDHPAGGLHRLGFASAN
jgi:hypothetical protein